MPKASPRGDFDNVAAIRNGDRTAQTIGPCEETKGATVARRRHDGAAVLDGDGAKVIAGFRIDAICKEIRGCGYIPVVLDGDGAVRPTGVGLNAPSIAKSICGEIAAVGDGDWRIAARGERGNTGRCVRDRSRRMSPLLMMLIGLA
jgi:hypothetical protein